jgi:hypothetical protein
MGRGAQVHEHAKRRQRDHCSHDTSHNNHLLPSPVPVISGCGPAGSTAARPARDESTIASASWRSFPDGPARIVAALSTGRNTSLAVFCGAGRVLQTGAAVLVEGQAGHVWPCRSTTLRGNQVGVKLPPQAARTPSQRTAVRGSGRSPRLPEPGQAGWCAGDPPPTTRPGPARGTARPIKACRRPNPYQAYSRDAFKRGGRPGRADRGAAGTTAPRRGPSAPAAA